MTRSTHLVRFLPLVILVLMLAHLVTPTPALADDSNTGTVVSGNDGPSIDAQLSMHPSIQDPCMDGRICINAHYPPITPHQAISITGYTPSGTTEQVMLTLTDPRTGQIVYSAYENSTPMVGDYAGYSAFRFAVSWHGFGGHNEYIVARVYTVAGAGKTLRIGMASNQVQVWSPGFTF